MQRLNASLPVRGDGLQTPGQLQAALLWTVASSLPAELPAELGARGAGAGLWPFNPAAPILSTKTGTQLFGWSNYEHGQVFKYWPVYQVGFGPELSLAFIEKRVLQNAERRVFSFS